MAKLPVPPLGVPSSRAEKMSIISALLGPEALARIREGQPDITSSAVHDPLSVDADRAAWHRNKLLERLRVQGRRPKGSTIEPEDSFAGNGKSSKTPVASPGRDIKSFPQDPTSSGLDLRIAAMADLNTLANEHPAIIMRLMQKFSRNDRVAALKSLPGPLARSIVKKLK